MRRVAPFLLSGLTCAAISMPTAMAQASPVVGPANADSYADWLTEAASRFALPVRWIRTILRAESAGQPQATSPRGAMGLMQIMPATWALLRNNLLLGDDPYDPHDNIIAGAAYIRMLLDRYGSPGWIAAYNAGPGRYEASLKGRSLPAETRAYTAAVVANLQRDRGGSLAFAATSVALVWTHAPLFIAQSDRKPTASSAPSGQTDDAAPNASGARHVSAIALRSDGLFVAQSGTGTAP